MSERETYTVKQFQEQHGLEISEATRLFAKFGPYKTDLDLLVAKKREFAESAQRSRRRIPEGQLLHP